MRQSARRSQLIIGTSRPRRRRGTVIVVGALLLASALASSVTPTGTASPTVVETAASPGAVRLIVHPTILRSFTERMTIQGFVSGAGASEKVTVQFKACGLKPLQFRDAYETTTSRGGSFSQEFPPPSSPGISGVFRAVSRDSVSAEVPVYHHAVVTLRLLGGGRLEASVTAKAPFWRRFVVLQRRARGAWVNVRRLVLTEQRSAGSSATFSTVAFRPPVPRGTQIRVVFPLSQAKPCYLAGLSEARRA
jgi:hypothetical protein